VAPCPNRGRAGRGDGGLGWYSILTADSLAAATGLAKTCPVLTGGGGVEVYETFDVM
jgi:hypothetical protein